MNSDLFFILKVGFGQLLSKNWPLSSCKPGLPGVGLLLCTCHLKPTSLRGI